MTSSYHCSTDFDICQYYLSYTKKRRSIDSVQYRIRLCYFDYIMDFILRQSLFVFSRE